MIDGEGDLSSSENDRAKINEAIENHKLWIYTAASNELFC